MLAAQEDIANRIVDLAKRKDMTVYQTVNDILEQALRVEELGMSLRQVVNERWMLEKAQETGFTFTIEQLLYRIVEEAYQENSEKSAEVWKEMGHWYGKYYEAKHDEPIEAFREALELFTMGTSEYTFENGNRQISFSLIGERLSTGYLELFSYFVEELLLVLGFNLNGKEIKPGIIKMELRQ
jgi:hypothetical protein